MTLLASGFLLRKITDKISSHPKTREQNDSDNESNKESDGEDWDAIEPMNAGWVDSVSKILRTKHPKGKKTLVLSRAKKLPDVKIVKPKTGPGFQIDGEFKEEKPDPAILDVVKEESDEPALKKRKELPKIRSKPNILDKDRERTLSKIATKGVVQLFNAVRTQQKDIDKKLKDAGPIDRKRENVMKNIDKRAFLDVLMDKKSLPVDGNVKNETKIESKTENKSTWNVLRDDFMMSAKLKDWDKESESEDADEPIEDLSDSD